MTDARNIAHDKKVQQEKKHKGEDVAAGADETPLGWVPRSQDFDLTGLDGFTPEKFEKVQRIDVDEWRRDVLLQDELFMKIYSYLPKEIIFQRELLVARL